MITNSRSVWMRVSCGAAALLINVLAGCGGGGQIFGTPDEGAQALAGALRAHNREQLEQVLGPDGQEIIFSGDEVADRHAADTFLTAYDRRHSVTIEGDEATLVVGDSDWPLPIPW